MTEKQKAARAKFKMAIAETKKLRVKNPKLTQAQALKQSFAILYSKDKVGAVKKKTAPKKVSSSHKDTKSHNVNIRVVSGVKNIGNVKINNMKNVIVNIKYGGYLVKFPYRDDLNFFADNEESLIEGLANFKISYKPAVYKILGSYSTFKLKKVTDKEIKMFEENISVLKNFKSK